MVKLISFVFIFILFVSWAFSQNVIVGKIVDNQEMPIEAANVYLGGTVYGAATNVDGEFKIENIPPGKYTLTISIIGYQLKEIPVEMGQEKVNLGVIDLNPSALQSQPIVVTAARHQQSLQDVSTSIASISQQEIEYRNAITIDDALKYESGINLTGNQVNIRGSTGYSRGVGSRVLMLVDGIPYMTGDTREANFESLQINQIERIEIVKGAGSALYGSNAIGGVINVIQKKIEPEASTNVRLYGGFYSNPHYKEWEWSERTRYLSGVKFDYSNKFGVVGLRLGAAHDQDDSYRKNDWMKRNYFSGMLEFDISPFDQFSVSANYMVQDRENFLYWKNLGNALIPTKDQLGDKIDSKRWHLATTYRHIFNQNNYYVFKAIWFQNRFNDNISSEEHPEGNESLSDYLDGEFQFNFTTGSHLFTFGIEANKSRASSNIFGNNEGYNAAFFAQDEINWQTNWTITPGIRLDYFNLDEVGSDYQINPKLGIVHKPLDKIAIRGSVGRGFRAPSIGEVFTNTTASGLQVIPNINLKPEESISGEVGYNQLLGQSMYLDVSFFYNRYWDMIEPQFTGEGEIQFDNVTNARGLGSEINFKLNAFKNRLFYTLGYTYADVREIITDENGNEELGRYLSFRPRHLFYTHIDYTWGDFKFGVDYRYMSAWDRIDEELVFFIEDVDERVDAHIVDFRIVYAFRFEGASMETSLQMNNLLQYHYLDVVGSIAKTRNIVLTLSGSF
jgi:iron complex outermembrane receptor protein